MMLDASIRAVSFDLDDTFWDCAPAIQNAERVLRDWLHKQAPAVLEQIDVLSILERRQRLVHETPELAGDVTATRKRLLAELYRDAGQDESTSEQAFAVFYRARSEVVLYEGVTRLLDALKPRYQVAAITNGNADLAQIGIADRFDIVLRATLDMPAKPDRAMFDRALEHFGIDAAAMLHVGDNRVTDVEGAQSAGVGAVWFNPPGDPWSGTAPAPEYTVRSIAELHRLLLG